MKRALPVLFSVLLIFSLIYFNPVALAQENCADGNHDYHVTTIQPTKELDGEKIYACKDCGFTFSKTLPATGHTWGKRIVKREATCTKKGLRYRICTRHANDPHRQEETNPAFGHVYTKTTTPADCEHDEMVNYTCTCCGSKYFESIGKATGHSYTESIQKEATCHEKGERLFTCEHCGDSYTEVIHRTESHTYSKTIIKEADCENEGQKSFVCDLCGDAYNEMIPALGHSYGEWVTDIEPTGETQGRRVQICVHNKDHIIEEFIPKLYIAKTNSRFPNLWNGVKNKNF